MSPIDFINSYYNWLGTNPEEVVYKRNEYLSTEGSIENYLYLIVSGAVRAIYASKEEEFTIRFGYKGSVISSLDSFITGKPSQFYLQAIRKTVVYRLEKVSYKAYVKSNSVITEIHNELMNGLLNSMLDREIDLLTSSPLERYNRVLKRSPLLFQEVPMKYIASYLRMSPETLSRLRNIDSDQCVS
jgi:CRP-like cAMP-binding protein